MITTFKNREEAGLLLAQRLKEYKNCDGVVLAIPRGGVPIGYAISKTLGLPLDILLSKKIGHPLNKEFAIGSVSLDSEIVNTDLNISKEYLHHEIIKIKNALKDRYELYRGNQPPLNPKGKMVILTDDGIATGHTLLAAIDMLRKQKAGKIIVAVPVVPETMVHHFIQATDEFIYLSDPLEFPGVGAFYQDFTQVSDQEVIRLLNDKKLYNRA